MTVPRRHSIPLVGLVVTLLVPLSACSGEAIQRALSADPNANRWGQNNPQAELPSDFPIELRYPNATLQAVTPAEQPSQTPIPIGPTTPNIQRETRWATPDPIDQVQGFYQKAFQASGWTVLDRPGQDANDQTTFEARRADLQVTVLMPSASQPVQAQPTTTEFVVQYVRSAVAAPQPSTSVEPTPSPEPVDSAQQFTDLDQAPEALRVYIEDLASLGVLPLRTADSQEPTVFKPNQPMTRREYAHWLVTVNNRMYRDRPARQIRLAPETASPAFQDVPRSDPDFPAIQGLAEAGYIPSSLSGATTAAFRPNAPLTREELLLWKVPIDTHQGLPTANLDAVKQTWGFQDASRIEPNASRAVLADHQNGDLANIRRVFGSTLLFQPKKPVTRAEAAAALWYIGAQGDGLSAQDVLKQPQANAVPPPSPANAPGN